MAWRRLCREVVRVGSAVLLVAAPASAQAPAPADDQYGQPVPAEQTPVPPQQTPVPGGASPGQGGGGPSSGSGGREPGTGVGGERESGTVGGRRETGSGTPGDAALPLADSRGGDLPFTGLDIAALVFLGLALLAIGTLIRALTRRRAAGDAT